MTPDEARERVRQLNDLNAFIALTDEQGTGDVVGVKDLIDVRGTVTTGGGKVLARVPSEDDATAIANLRLFGCVVVGKTNLSEWAMRATGENPHFGPVRNPHDLSRMAGGSSGGSAAAVAAGMCDWAVGTDTGGSIRIPASLCGVVGLKPSLGTVSTEGVLPLSHSSDTVGALAKTVRAAARALEMLTGSSGFVPSETTHPAYRLAVPAGWIEDLDPVVDGAWRRVSSGLPEIAFPDRLAMTETLNTIVLAEAASHHRRSIQRHPDRYGSDVLADFRTGLAIGRNTYVSALVELRRFVAQVAVAMSDVDAILVPGPTCVAPLIGQQGVRERLNRYTKPFSLTGQPVIALPLPSTSLPVGIQVVGQFGKDRELIRIAAALEARFAMRTGDLSPGPSFTFDARAASV